MERIKTKITKLREGERRLGKEIKERTIGYMLAAFSFVAGLAWNEAIKSFIDQFFPNSANSVLVKFIYALVITVVVVIVTFYLLKLNNKGENK